MQQEPPTFRGRLGFFSKQQQAERPAVQIHYSRIRIGLSTHFFVKTLAFYCLYNLILWILYKFPT